MILRYLALRQSRSALSPRLVRSCQRWQSSHVDSLEASAQNSLQETQAIEAFINASSSQPVSPIDPQTNASTETSSISVARDYHAFRRQKELIGHLGSDISPHYQPHTLVTNPPSPKDITLELLLASQSHLGHATSLWNPANAQYIFGVRDGVHVISLEVTAAYLRRAARMVREVSKRGGLLLFVGTRPGQDRCVVKAAELAGGCHLFQRWTPGSITNGQQILGKCKMKVVNEFDQEIPGYQEQLADRAVIKPDLVICLNPLENYVLLHECGQANIPTIGIIDTDANPKWVTYPIPANDDSLRCVQVIAGVLGRAAEEGKVKRLEAAKNGHLTYHPVSGLRQSDTRKEKSFEIFEDEFEDLPDVYREAVREIKEEERRIKDLGMEDKDKEISGEPESDLSSA